MGLSGHVFDMIQRIEANRAQLRARHDRTADQFRRYAGKAHGNKTSEKPVSPEQLAAVKREIRARAQRSRRKRMIAACIVCAAGLGVMIWLIYLYLNF